MRPPRRKRLERRERLARVRIVQYRLPVRERAALGVLAGEPDRDSVLEERGERERLRVSPVDPAFAQGLATAFELPCELRVDVEALRYLQELVAELEEPFGGDGRDDCGARVRFRRGLRRWNRGRKARPQLVVGSPQRLEGLLEHALRFVRCDDAVGDELLRIRHAHRGLLLDPLCLQRLGVRSFVLLVVTESAIADEVDDEVVAELLSIRQPEADCGERGLGVVCVHVDDGYVEPLREVAGVPRRPALHGIRREPDLVVGDHVQRPARRVAVEAVQVEGLGDDPLPCKRGIAVDEYGQRDRGIVDSGAGRAIRLLGSGESLDDRVDGLEMARVGCHGDLDLTGRRLSWLRRREVILDVSRPSLRIGDQRVDRALAFELPQDRGVRPPDNVRQDVQATTVSESR